MSKLDIINMKIAKEQRYLESCGYVRSRQLGALIREQKQLYKTTKG